MVILRFSGGQLLIGGDIWHHICLNNNFICVNFSMWGKLSQKV